MTSESKQVLCEKVVDLTVMNRMQATATVNGTPDPDMAKKMRARMREEQIALHMKHFEADQLVAMLDFFSTEVGASILQSQKEMAADVHSGFRLVSGDYSKDAFE